MLSRLKTLYSIFTGDAYRLQFQYNTEYGPYIQHYKNSVSEPFYLSLEKAIKKYVKKQDRVLDAGCGLGRLVISTANTGVKEVVGIDTNRQFLFEAAAIAGNHRSHLVSYPCHGTYQFLYADVQNLPFNKASFSVALCINVIDRIKNPKLAVDQLYRVLEPKGLLFLCDPYDWFEDVTPRPNRISNLREILAPSKWSILEEVDPLFFSIYINPRRMTIYQNHLVIAKKKI